MQRKAHTLWLHLHCLGFIIGSQFSPIRQAVDAARPDLATKTSLQRLPLSLVYPGPLFAVPPEVIYARLYVSLAVNFKSLEPLGSIVA